MKKLLMILFPLLLLPVFSALAEPSVTFSPAAPRVGDYVDVIVTPDRESPQGYTYSLSLGEEAVYTGKDMSEHAAVSFRPRQEGVYTLTVTVTYGKKDQETASVTVPVSGEAPRQEGADVVYSQKDGWWHDKVYSKTYHRSVEKSGCALFALSHALQRMGHITDSAMPDALATRYSFCYVKDRGTSNEVLLTQAGKAFNFTTQSDLTESAAEIAACLNRGDLFSFDIVRSHIAMADGISEDGTKVHVVDSASGVTFERMVNGAVWIQAGDGSFVKAEKPEDLPGNRWFFETQEYAGMEYWLDLSYCAKRGMRLIRQPWLKLITEDGPVDVTLSQTGALISQVQLEDETLTVETRDLQWTSRGLEGPAVAMITSTGFVASDYMVWPPILWMIVFFLMFPGGASGSTAGGMKWVRVAIFAKSAIAETKRRIHPNAVIPVRFNGRTIREQTTSNIVAFMFFYIVIIVMASLWFCGCGIGFDEALGIAVSMIGNVGVSIGQWGSSGCYAALPVAAKWMATFVMLIGRLEIFTVILLFSRALWKK